MESVRRRTGMEGGGAIRHHDIAVLLEREARDGYDPVLVSLPRRGGCRVCGSTDGGISAGFMGSRLEGRGLYVYAFVTLCSACAADGTALRTAERMIVDRFMGKGKGPEIPEEPPAPSE